MAATKPNRAYLPHYNHRKEYESPLHRFRVACGLGVNELAAKAGVIPDWVVSLANGTKAPIDAKGAVKPQAQRICDALSVDVADLFPRYVCSIRPNDISDEDVIEGSMSEYHRSATMPAELLPIDRLSIWEQVSHLRPQEEYVIRARFIEDATLEEVGQELAVTKERVRQIEAKALRKLRHPSVRAFLEGLPN